MNFAFSEEAEQLRAEIRAVLDRETELGFGYRVPEAEIDYPKHVATRRRLAQHGWFGLGIPPEYGGSGGGIEERYVAAAEFALYGAPYPKVAMTVVAPTLLAHASEPLKRKLLPEIAEGDAEFALGYTEPGAGSDLASLTTRAVRNDGRYVISGQKLYTSFMHRAEYCLVAARTDTEAPPHKGISLFLVDVDAPGITFRPLWGMGDLRSNVTFLDDVVVGAENLIGEENRGWTYLRTALHFERLAAFPLESLLAIYNDLLELLGSSVEELDPTVAQAVGGIYVDICALDTLTRRNLWYLEAEREITYESSQIKILASEIRQKLVHTAVAVLGAEAQLIAPDPDAPLGGAFYRVCEGVGMQIFGAGANEIQRDIIASRGLNLPRGA